jgi:dipeptidyl aminopeptidase/acylaminoacyl peptidase
MELADYYKVETASTPSMSLDGRRVAFVRSYIVEAENRHNTEIWIRPSDGSQPALRLTNPAFSATAPVWSPDGKLLAFHSNRKGSGDVWFLRMDGLGGEAFQIPGVAGAPAFSPDNRWIAFTKKAAIEKKPPAATAFEQTMDDRFKGRIYDWMNFRFDGRGFLPDPRDPAASPASELYIVPRDGGSPQQLTTLNVDVQSPVWSADSSRLAFAADSHQRDEYSYERPDLWIVDLNGQLRRLTDDGYEYDSPAWAPDGRSLVARRRQSLNQVIASRQNHGAAVDLYRVQIADGSMRNLTADWDLIPDSPHWTGNGEFVYFGGAVGGDTQLFRLAAGGGRVEQLTKGDRSLAGFTFSQGFDTMAYSATDASHPAQIYAAKVTGGGEVKLSSLNGWISTVDLAKVEKVHYQSPDGTPIEAYLSLPASAKQDYPLIVSIHGGPHGAYGSAFNFQFQWMAANGFAVLAPNPRGSTGYGEKFLWGSWGGWGKLDTPDVMAGVDYVLGHYPVDRNKLAVTGYSYGGYLTNWIVTQTKRFAVAISGAGVVNWISDYGTADIPRSKESEFYGTPWQPESRDLLRGASPITYAGNIETPMLFVNGESDMRVPIEEAEQLYTALKKRSIPAKFIRYPGNYHGNWPPWDMVHSYYQEMAWFKQYLH